MAETIIQDETKRQYVPDQFGPIIAWSGGECPVHPNTIVRLHFRARGPYVGEAIHKPIPEHLRDGIWQHAPAVGRTSADFDVIAYQVLHG